MIETRLHKRTKHNDVNFKTTWECLGVLVIQTKSGIWFEFETEKQDVQLEQLGIEEP